MSISCVLIIIQLNSLVVSLWMYRLFRNSVGYFVSIWDFLDIILFLFSNVSLYDVNLLKFIATCFMGYGLFR